MLGCGLSDSAWPQKRVCERDRRGVAKGVRWPRLSRRVWSFSCNVPCECWGALRGLSRKWPRGEECGKELGGHG